MICTLGNIDTNKISKDSLGGKALTLDRLIKKGILVPRAFVVDGRELPAYVLKKYDEMGFQKVAVRSSANVEDSGEQSFAGLFDSYLNIEKHQLIQSIKECLASQFSERVLKYKKNNCRIIMSVIVQEMVCPDYAGVAFSMDPVNGDHNKIIIEVVEGGAEKLVQGEVTPAYYEISKKSLEVLHADCPFNQKSATKDLRNIASLILKIQKTEEMEVDVEWLVKNGEIFVVQSRPITNI